jgi:hypothetical protein
MARHPLAVPLPKLVLAAVAAAVALAVSAGAAQAQAPTSPQPPGLESCPTFRVLHNDPQAGYRAGTYDMQVWGNVTCKQAVRIFQRYLSNPKSLPSGWWVSPTQPAIVKGRTGRTGFSLSLKSRRTTPHTNGSVTTCPRRVRFQNPVPASGYEAGSYTIQIFGVATCNQAAEVLDDWLSTGNLASLPAGWFPFADTPGFYYNRGPGGGFYVFKP